jgi:hypothetical protein
MRLFSGNTLMRNGLRGAAGGLRFLTSPSKRVECRTIIVAVILSIYIDSEAAYETFALRFNRASRRCRQ